MSAPLSRRHMLQHTGALGALAFAFRATLVGRHPTAGAMRTRGGNDPIK